MYIKFDFPNFRALKKVLIQHRNFLFGLDKNSAVYKDELRAHFKMLIFVKAHALALDTETERKRLLNLLMSEMKVLKMF
ncbi:hypothetical protein D4R52_03640 [bacterium]|nr:MAG: hypothetical protein D4R52_03640 [bacterium]